ncbi:MAG: ABC transporter ATP-binding protein [Vicinamibacterales bacterium]
MSVDPAIRLVDVSRQFAAGGTVVRAVDAVSLEVACGSMTALVGPSGSGKTTLLSLVGGLLPPTSGTVVVDGVEISALDQRALTAFRLRHVGIVFQAFHLIDALPVVENVELPLSLAGVRRPAAQARAGALVDRLGLGARARFHPPALSGGEQQRCAIARALANDPAVVLADEPTGSLDAQAGDAVIALLRAEATERGRAVVVASHDPRVAQAADRVVRMAFGRVAESGPA